MEDFYSLLGISKDSPNSAIIKSYQKLCDKYHPGKNTAPGTAEKFAGLFTAACVLTNPSARKLYDKLDSLDKEQLKKLNTYIEKTRDKAEHLALILPAFSKYHDFEENVVSFDDIEKDNILDLFL